MKALTFVLAACLALSLALTGSGCSATSSTSEKTGLHASAPEVVGLAQAQAEEAITSAGFEVGAVTARSAPDTPAGIVVEQDPVAGTALARKTAIDLVVAAP